MRYVASSALAAELDRRAIEDAGIPGFALMERAALAGARLVQKEAPQGTVVALCGRGNNGGDGIAMARILSAWGREAIVVLHSGEDLSPDAALNMQIARALGVTVERVTDVDSYQLPERAAIVIDAIYGIGFRGTLDARERETFASLSSSPVRVLAVDVPSGTHADTGSCDPGSPVASWTVVPGTLKWAHLIGEAAERCGEILMADIGLPASWLQAEGAGLANVVERSDIVNMIRPLPRNAHKGHCGLVKLMAGSAAMPGAASLAARAAFLGGSGRVAVAAEPSVLQHVLALVPECTPPPEGATPDAVLVGCGRGLGEDTLAEVRTLVQTAGPPVVVDADALTVLSRLDMPFDRRTAVLTPHPGELSRLVGSSTAEVLADLPSATLEAARRYNAIVVAKTAGALVTTPDGRQWFVEPGSPGMATAGTGDVLAGLVAGLLPRQGALEAAVIGAWLHAAAGRFAADRKSAIAMRATDLLDAIPEVLCRLWE